MGQKVTLPLVYEDAKIKESVWTLRCVDREVRAGIPQDVSRLAIGHFFHSLACRRKQHPSGDAKGSSERSR